VTHSSTRCVATLVLLAGILSFGAVASAGAEPRGVRPARATLQKIQDSLEAGEWKKAEKRANGLLRSMSDDDVSGVGSRPLYGLAFAFRAIAVEEQGRHDEAMWDWGCARMLSEQAVAFDPRRFGEGAVRLEADRTKPRPAALDPKKLAADHPETFEWPRQTHAPMPEYSDFLRGRRRVAEIEVWTRLTADGRLRDPEVVPDETASENTSFLVRTLVAFRDWRFEPATLDGQPVEVTYWLTTKFSVE